MSTRNRTLFGASCSLALVLALAACGGPPGGGWGPPQQGETEGEEEEKATPVVVVPVTAGDITAVLTNASTIEAESSVTVHAEATGRINAISFEEGDAVKKGDRLAQVRRDAQSSQLDRASATFEKAEIDYKRIKSLFDQGAASKEELDNAANALRTAKIERRDRKRDLSDTRVIAPFSGTITERFVNEGAFVTSGAQLFSIADFNTLVARVYIPEKELDRISVGQTAQITGKAAKGRAGEGRVSRIAPIVDASTGTVKVTVSLPAELAGGETGFLPGMYAEVILTTERHEGVPLLPKPALIHEEEQVFVFVLEGERAKRKLIEVGLGDEDRVEVLSGVALGDKVVLSGQAGMKDGALVQIVDALGRDVEAAGGTGGDETADAVATAPKSGGS